MVLPNLKLLVEEVLGVEISDSDGLGTIDEWDSMAQLSILLAIESQHNIKFSLSELTNVTTLSSWILLTNQKIQEKK